jgi:hypothetical protein
MSDSVFLFNDPMDLSWDVDKLEPDDLEMPADVENIAQDYNEDVGLRDEADQARDRIARPTEENWNDLALDDFVVDNEKDHIDDTGHSMNENTSSS